MKSVTQHLEANNNDRKFLLGTNAKSLNPPPDPSLLRVRRWALQEASRSILSRETRKDKKGRIQRAFRVSNCCRARRADKLPEIRKRGDKHHYANLQTCGSVWVCPVCGSIISERRRLEIQRAVKSWENKGGTIVMLTLTVPHYETDSLKSVLKRFKKARWFQRNRKPWKRWASRYLFGNITAQEVTHGSNGWHVHTHEILFLNSDFVLDHQAYRSNNPDLYVDFLENKRIHASDPEAFFTRADLKDPFLVMQGKLLFPTWRDAVISAGLPAPSITHGLDLSDNSEVAGYVGKWGVDYELTKAHLKNGRVGGRTPWAILSDFLQFGDMADHTLFREFAICFKGTRQLVWSQGLKDALAIRDLDDDEILKEAEKGIEVITLTIDQWRTILFSDQRGQVLEIANNYGRHAVVDFIAELKNSLWLGESQRSDHLVERQRLKKGGAMAHRKLMHCDLLKIQCLRYEYGLSLGQCCIWLEKRRNINISRTGLYNRLKTL